MAGRYKQPESERRAADPVSSTHLPVPPTSQPEVGAEAIHYAAYAKRREVWCGGSTVYTILGERLAPWLGDRYLAKTGVSGQQTDEPLRAVRIRDEHDAAAQAGGALAGTGEKKKVYHGDDATAIHKLAGDSATSPGSRCQWHPRYDAANAADVERHAVRTNLERQGEHGEAAANLARRTLNTGVRAVEIAIAVAIEGGR